MHGNLYESLMKHVKKALVESIMRYEDEITLILNDNTEITPEELDDDMFPVFLKISNNSLKACDNEILIAITHAHMVSFEPLSWSSGNMQLTNMQDEILSASDKCEKMLQKTKRSVCGMPSLNYCNDLVINLEGVKYKGYLPSLAQLEIMNNYLDYINEIFEYIGAEPLNIDNAWSCDEESIDKAWALIKRNPITISKHAIQSGGKKIRTQPIFKKIEKEL